MALRQVLIAIATIAIAASPSLAQQASTARQERAIIEQLLAAPSQGLDPADYNAWALDSMARRVDPAAPVDHARFEVLLFASMTAYLRDLHSGRARFAPFVQSTEDVEWTSALRSAVAGDSIAKLVGASEPPFTQYRNLRVHLERYRRLASSSAPPSLPAGPSIRPGEPYTARDALRRRLELEGDLPVEPATVIQSGGYDDVLALGVRRFQQRHGLAADGILGKQTIGALNTPFSFRIHQIELAMERLRWLPRLGARPFVVVNVPAFELFAFDSTGGTGAPALDMKVVVGKALETRTPLLFEQMRYIDFRPYWNVPRSILVAEILPQLHRHPEYLRRHRMEVIAVKSGRLLGDAVSSDVLEGLAKAELRVRQRPGPSNALGLIKFAFPNAAGVYMHGTPETELFSQTRRDFSHGCIRVEAPEALANWLLRDKPDWTLDSITAAMNASRSRRVTLTRPIPVALFYTTAVARPDGEVRFYPDIYGSDRVLDDLLRGADPAPPGVATTLPAR